MYGVVYDAELTIDQVLTALAEQPKEIAALTAGLARTRLHDPPSRGAWSLNDVLAQLRSCSDMWGNHIATILAEDRPTIRAMNTTTWIKSTNYPELEFRALVARLYEAAWRAVGAPATAAEGRLVTYCDGDGAPESHAKGQ